MEQILNKQEIADLLKALREGNIPLDAPSDQYQDKFLNCKELDLFHMTIKQSEETRFPNFDLILDNFCKHYSIALTNELQRTFTLSRARIESKEFQEFIDGIGKPGAIALVNLLPLKQGALLIFNPQFSFSLVEIMLGASVQLGSQQIDRSMTTLELTILKPLLNLACNSFNKAFKPLLDLTSSLHRVESNPRLVSITEPDAEVLICTLSVEIRDISGEITLVFPMASLSPLREKLKSLVNVHELSMGSWRRILEQSLHEIPTTLVARSGTLNLTVGDILGLKEGDIIPLDYDPHSPLRILVGDRLKFFAKPGTHLGKKAISITGVYES